MAGLELQQHQDNHAVYSERKSHQDGWTPFGKSRKNGEIWAKSLLSIRQVAKLGVEHFFRRLCRKKAWYVKKTRRSEVGPMMFASMKKLLLGSTLAFALCSGMASAATVTLTALPTASVANPIPSATTPIYHSNVTGDIVNGNPGDPGDARSVWNSLYSTVPVATGVYSSVSKNGSATFSFVGAQNVLQFVWGSVDNYNFLTFYLGSVQVDVFSFTNLASMQAAGFVGGRSAGQDSMTARITDIGAGGVFDRVVLTATQDAFEFANLRAAQVPLPAGGLLLVGALGGLAFARRRRAA
jgi:hypothetical protein